MICPKCGSSQHKVVDTQPGEARKRITIRHVVDNYVARRRKCIDCSHKWITIEVKD